MQRFIRNGSNSSSLLLKKKIINNQIRFNSSIEGSKPASPRSFVGSSLGSGGIRTATLVLEDGSRFIGASFGYEKSVTGEVVFNTGMVGYPESLTDPSYRGQLLVSTYPLVGNYGVPDGKVVDQWGLSPHFESERIHAEAFIVSDYSHAYSSWEAKRSLRSWLQEQKVPGIYGIDTRLLTQKIRDKGAMLAKIEFTPSYMPPGYEEIKFKDPNARNLVAEVSCTDRIIYGKGNPIKILTVDCGIKNNIIRHLVSRGAELHRVPWDTKIAAEANKYDALFFSNGPGDPSKVDVTVKELQQILKDGYDKPIFGICMGNQLLGRAAGAETYKLTFGHRGQNQPVLNVLTGQCYITPQNHGYALNASKLPSGWQPLFVNRNDGSNEGIMHKEKPYFTAQFHPEAKGGPSDTSFLFDKFFDLIKSGDRTVGSAFTKYVPQTRIHPKKVLLLGSGGLTIGQAGEFDYSGNQAIKSLKEEGLSVILMNPNIASVQTNTGGKDQADKVYFLPVTIDYIEEVIKREKPDGIVLSMGGQTALNVGVDLYQKGILKKYNVKVLGTSVDSIIATEDRGIFADKLKEINESLAYSFAVNSVEDALIAGEKVKYPCMIRSAFSLGGLGSGICKDAAQLKEMATVAFATCDQILVEESMLGWKELEYEVVRDAADNCITVCNMENFDPLGIHTGESIVVAPSQTLTNDEYHMLRDTSIKVIRHLGIVGECNIQYALHPTSKRYCIIEVNPRLSRSSALASKATGYPLAHVAAKLALGMHLPDLRNSVTLTTTACFEPSLDYIVTKIPRWDLTKFDRVSRRIGSSMKSVGEVMAIGRTFEESFQKALRMTNSSVQGFEPTPAMYKAPESAQLVEKALVEATDTRVFTIAHAMQNLGWTPEKINKLTAIDTWFLNKLSRLVNIDSKLRASSGGPYAISGTLLLESKKSGFSDRQIASRIGSTELFVRNLRKEMGIKPFVKQIDTLAGEVPAKTNYLYMTYNGDSHDIDFGQRGTMVLGSGCYRIGSSVEFDWCSVSAIRTLRKLGIRSVMVNYNPETVSTDYDECDRLYFEELSLERVLDIYEQESCDQAIVSVGGQIPNNLAVDLTANGVKVAGTTTDSIDCAEDRDRFSKMCDQNGIDQPEWNRLKTTEEAFDFADTVGYPVLVRPSYVLSGAAMNVAYTPGELSAHLQEAGEVSDKHPVVISKFIEGGREIDVDCVADKGVIICHAVSEHVENAGVHSGDATLVLPPYTVSEDIVKKCRETAAKVAKALNITGPFNMQLIAKDGNVKIIEANLRASRSFPFSSKTVGTDFIDIATRVMLGKPIPDDVKAMDLGIDGKGSYPKTYYGVKAPMFSFKRLAGADPSVGVEMASTGEVACYGLSVEEAFIKSYLSTLQYQLPTKKKVLVSIQKKLRGDAIPSLRKLHEMGFTLCATEETAEHLKSLNIPVTHLHWPESKQEPNIETFLAEKKLDMVFMFSNQSSRRIDTNYKIRRMAVDFGIPLITNLQVAAMLTDSISQLQNKTLILEPKTLVEYIDFEKSNSKKAN